MKTTLSVANKMPHSKTMQASGVLAGGPKGHVPPFRMTFRGAKPRSRFFNIRFEA